jgi:hypothetical protein
MSDGLIESYDRNDGDGPNGQALLGAVEVHVLVAGNSSLISGW